MSWSIEEHIGEGRPWPEQVVVYRGETDESLTYARRSLSDVNKMVELMDMLAAENAKLRELATMLHICARGMLRDLAPSCVDGDKEGCGMDCTDNGESCCMEMLERRMRELGVEVDG